VETIADRLATAPQVPGRMERIAERPCTILRDYSHKPDALERALESVRPLTPGRLILVFGAGGDRDRGKRAPMGEIAVRLAALGVSAPAELRFTGVTTDTRHLAPGTLFVALKGDRFDAHDFLADARTKGAAAAVVRRGTPRVDGLPLFEVADTLAALGLLARARRRRLPPTSPVVAITGSSGKTSAKEMIRAV